jgi:hypothetical protein
MDKHHTLTVMMDGTFKALIDEWQEAVYSQGESGTTMLSLATHLKSWLGDSVSMRDRTDPRIVRLVPDRLSARIAQIASDGRVSRPYMMLAVLVGIERMLQAIRTPEAERAASLWSQRLMESWLSRLWLADFDHLEDKRSFNWP